jgi:hypothetical protein
MSKAAAFLLLLGLAQMLGDILHFPALKAAGAATGASPAPKVFTAVQGLETYSTRFFLEWTDAAGGERSVELTPEVYGRLRGPYNRRNVYGAVLAFGPVLSSDPRTRPMFESVANYALCGRAPVLRELGLDPAAMRGGVRLRLEPRPREKPKGLPLVFQFPCD